MDEYPPETITEAEIDELIAYLERKEAQRYQAWIRLILAVTNAA